MKKYIPFLAVIIAFASCKKDPVPDKPAVVQQSGFAQGQGMFITNEGNYGFSNAKVSYYNFNGTVTTDVFQPTNGRPLGDVCQGMTIIGSKGYVLVNNSNKVEVVNMNDFHSVATITGFNSPRYFLPVSATKAYVTDLYSNAITIVNLNTNTISGSIPCIGWTEQLVKSGNNVYVANHANGKVYVINSITDVISDSIAVAKGANSFQFDSSNKLWVLCGGEATSSAPGGLYKINTITDAVEQSFSFAVSESPWRLKINNTGDTLYYLNNGVDKMWTGAGALPSSAFIPQGSRNFYALGINPANNQLYVSDAIDYTQAGKIYLYSNSGAEQSHFNAGTIPGDFIFY